MEYIINSLEYDKYSLRLYVGENVCIEFRTQGATPTPAGAHTVAVMVVEWKNVEQGVLFNFISLSNFEFRVLYTLL